MVELQGCFGLIVGSASQVIPQLDNFAGHNLNFETERLRLLPFKDADFDLALPFYGDTDFLLAMEGQPPEEPVNGNYLRLAGKAMARQGFLFAIVEKVSDRTIGEVCLQWMNLERAKIANEKTMRVPIGIWDKSPWGVGYGKEVLRCLMAFAFEELGIDRLCAMDVSICNTRSVALWRSCDMTVSRELGDGETLDFEITRVRHESVHQVNRF